MVVKFKEIMEAVKIMKEKERIVIMIFVINLNDIKKVLKKKKI